MISDIKILYHQGKQYIKDLQNAEVPGIFRGRPVISLAPVDTNKLVELCPSHAISSEPVSIDLGKCLFCGECARVFPEKIIFTKDYKISANSRDDLIINEGVDTPIRLNPNLIRKEISKIFSKLKSLPSPFKS